MDVMYWGVVHPVLEVLPSMRVRRSGRIAVTSSIGGRVSVPHMLAYSPAKFAATGFADGWFSIIASAPLIAMSSRRAARQIVRAVERGDPQLIVGLPAQAAIRAHGLLPGTTGRVLSVGDRLLPSGDGSGTERRLGKDSRTRFSESFLTVLGRRAARRNRQ